MIVDILTRVSLLAGVGCRHIQHNANVDSVTAGHRRETRGAPDNQLGTELNSYHTYPIIPHHC